MSILKKATNKMAYAKVGIYGEAGSGKTYTAAQLAIGLHKFAKLKKPVAMFDTEPAASYIIPLFEKAGIEFLVADESRALVDVMKFMKEAEEQCSIVIIDSVTHIWRECQESFMKKINDTRRSKGQKPIFQLEFQHWRPIKNAWQQFTDKYLSSKLHCIICGRAGSIYEYQANDQGKKELITSGTKMATEKEMGYEPSLLIEMIKHREGGKLINRALIEKDRAHQLNGKEINYPTFDNMRSHFEFLNLGGNHFESMNQNDSTELFTETGEDTFSYERKQREIWCEEIQGILTKYYPSRKEDDIKAKADLIDMFFKTRSWTKVEDTQSDVLKAKFLDMKTYLTSSDKKTEEDNSDFL